MIYISCLFRAQFVYFLMKKIESKMLCKSNNQPGKDIFRDYDRVDSNANYTKKLSDPTAWHNLFYEIFIKR
jgi:hypothetical protein